MERLQKVIAQTNIASRRQAEQMILDGRIKVNGVVVKELGTKVSKNDEILVDNKKIKLEKKIYLLMNKPTGYLVTTSDNKERRTVMDLLLDEYKGVRVYPVGRLDYDMAGLILLTNDGDLTLKLTNKNMVVEEEFFVRVQGVIIRKDMARIRKGIKLPKHGFIKPTEVNLIEHDKTNQSTLLRFVFKSTNNVPIKEMMKEYNYPSKNITRVGYDFLTLEGVKRGGYRALTVHEVRKLHSKQIKK